MVGLNLLDSNFKLDTTWSTSCVNAHRYHCHINVIVRQQLSSLSTPSSSLSSLSLSWSIHIHPPQTHYVLYYHIHTHTHNHTTNSTHYILLYLLIHHVNVHSYRLLFYHIVFTSKAFSSFSFLFLFSLWFSSFVTFNQITTSIRLFHTDSSPYITGKYCSHCNCLIIVP